MKIAIEDSLGKEYTGEFNSIEEAYEFYQTELDDLDIIITQVKGGSTQDIKNFAYWYDQHNEILTDYEEDSDDFGHTSSYLVLEDFPIIFENMDTQSILEEEIKNLIAQNSED